MAARRRPRARPARRDGWLAWAATALVGLVVIAGGFGAGVLLGVLTEEPGAIVGALAGRGERVALQPGDETAQDLAARAEGEEPAALPARREEAGERLTRSAAGGARGVEPAPLPAVSAPPTGFAVQVGAFTTSEAARAMRAKLAARGYESFVAPSAGARDRRWRVRVGPFAERAQADRTAGQLERGEGLSTWVVDLDERSRN